MAFFLNTVLHWFSVFQGSSYAIYLYKPLQSSQPEYFVCWQEYHFLYDRTSRIPMTLSQNQYVKLLTQNRLTRPSIRPNKCFGWLCSLVFQPSSAKMNCSKLLVDPCSAPSPKSLLTFQISYWNFARNKCVRWKLYAACDQVQAVQSDAGVGKIFYPELP
jgi:hypothetical protein